MHAPWLFCDLWASMRPISAQTWVEKLAGLPKRLNKPDKKWAARDDVIRSGGCRLPGACCLFRRNSAAARLQAGPGLVMLHIGSRPRLAGAASSDVRGGAAWSSGELDPIEELSARLNGILYKKYTLLPISPVIAQHYGGLWFCNKTRRKTRAQSNSIQERDKRKGE